MLCTLAKYHERGGILYHGYFIKAVLHSSYDILFFLIGYLTKI